MISCSLCEKVKHAVFYSRGHFYFHSSVLKQVLSPAAFAYLTGIEGRMMNGYCAVLSSALAIALIRKIGLHKECHPAALKAYNLFSSALSTPLDVLFSSADLNHDPPNGLKYMPFQRRSIAAASFIVENALSGGSLKGVIIGDDMGLGKTVQAAGIINQLHDKIENVLVVCPKIMISKFEAEFKKWLLCNPNIVCVNSALIRSGSLPLFTGNKNIFIINYDIIAKAASLFSNVVFDVVICDEAHYLKNPKSARTAAILGRQGRAAMKPLIHYRSIIHMSGTPIKKDVEDIFTLLKSVDPRGWNKSEFMRRYANKELEYVYFGRRSGMAYVDCEWVPAREREETLLELSGRMQGRCMVRRLKSDVLKELPEKIRELLVIEQDTALSNLVSKESKIAKEASLVLDAMSIDRSKAAEFSRLMGKLKECRLSIALAKIPHIVDEVRNAVDNYGKKIAVFTYHRRVAEACAHHLGCEYVHGEMDVKERLERIRAFASSADGGAIVMTMSSCGVGIDITEASTAMFIEMDWIPITMLQAEDRLYRIGQKSSVLCRYVVVNNSIDYKIASRVLSRAAISSKALGDGQAEFAFGDTAAFDPSESLVGSVLREYLPNAATQGV